MTEKSFNIKLTKKEALLLDHGRFKGMMDMIQSIEKRIVKKRDDGKEIDLKTLVSELAIHKVKANKMLNESAKKLHAETQEKEE